MPSKVPKRKPNFLPIFDIRNEAGIAALAIPIICTAIGKVARSADGAILIPTIPPNKTTMGAAVCPKH